MCSRDTLITGKGEVNLLYTREPMLHIILNTISPNSSQIVKFANNKIGTNAIKQDWLGHRAQKK